MSHWKCIFHVLNHPIGAIVGANVKNSLNLVKKLEVCSAIRQCEQRPEGASVDTNGNVDPRDKPGLLNFGQLSVLRHDKNDCETDKDVLARREKQMEYCKKTDDYRAFFDAVPKNHRVQKMPRLSNMSRKYSRRQ